MSILTLRRRLAPFVAVALALIVCAVLVGTSHAVEAPDRTAVSAWDGYDAVDPQVSPHGSAAADTADEAVESTRDRADCPLRPPPLLWCGVRDQREAANATLAGKTGTATGLVDRTPSSVCAEHEGRSLTCTRGGDCCGTTYYKGSADYECELHRPEVRSTNNREARIYRNSFRFCRGTRDGTVVSKYSDDSRDYDTYSSATGPPDTLVEASFSVRWRWNYCFHKSDSSVYSRCAYNWAY